MYIQICIYLDLLFIDAGLLWSLDKDCNRKKKKNQLLSKNQEWICYTNIRVFFIHKHPYSLVFLFDPNIYLCRLSLLTYFFFFTHDYLTNKYLISSGGGIHRKVLIPNQLSEEIYTVWNIEIAHEHESTNSGILPYDWR